MKILCVSDLHGERRWFEWLLRAAQEVDLVSIAGDLLDGFHPEGVQHQIDYIIREWLPRWPVNSTALAVSSGNHDYDNGWMAALPGTPGFVGNGESRVLEFAHRRQIVVTTTPYPDTIDQTNHIMRLWETGAQLRGKTRLPWLVLYHEPPAVICPGSGSSLLDDLIEEWSPNFVHCGHAHDLPSRRRRFIEPVGLSKVLNAGQVEGVPSPCAIKLDLLTETAIRSWWHDGKRRESRVQFASMPHN